MPRRELAMRYARFVFVVASGFAFQLAACGGGDSTGSGTGASTAGTSSSGAAGNTSSSSSGGSSSGGSSSGGSSSGAASDAGTAAASPCTPLIGKWTATLDPGAVATGTDTLLTGPVPIGGTIDFVLTHDDADLPNVVDFNGTANITASGQTFSETIAPSKSPSGDTKDTECNGGLHLKGLVNVTAIGDLVFAIDGTLDTTATPTSGVGTFTWKTVADDGGGLSATGTLHMVKK
jgi:hypothetical protein